MFGGRLSPYERICVGVIGSCAALTFLLALSGCGSSSAHKLASSGSPIGNAGTGTTAAAVLGYVWDSRAPGLRAINGVLGAAHLESGTIGGTAFTSGAPCASKGFALLTDSAGAVQMITLSTGQLVKVADPVAKNEHIQLSPSCSNALIYASGVSSGALISGLPSSPQSQAINVTSSGVIAGAAVADTGSVLIADRHADGSSTVRISTVPDNQFQALAVMKTYGAMTFLPGGNTAVLADSGASIVTLVTPQATGPVVTQLASSVEGVSKPLAIAGSSDGHFVFVANGAGSTISRFDLTGTSAPISTVCACNASELIPLSGNAVFQLNDPAAGTIFALEGDAKTPRAIFIPTDKIGALSGGAQ